MDAVAFEDLGGVICNNNDDGSDMDFHRVPEDAVPKYDDEEDEDEDDPEL